MATAAANSLHKPNQHDNCQSGYHTLTKTNLNYQRNLVSFYYISVIHKVNISTQ